MLEAITNFFNTILTYFYILLSFYYSLYKYLLHKLSGKCEITRICCSSPKNANYVSHLESSFLRSKDAKIRQFAELKSALDIKNFVKYVLESKCIKQEEATKIEAPLSKALECILSYNSLVNEMEILRSTNYDSGDLALEHELYEVWSNLKPDENLNGRFTEQWTEIGFQGKDPATDFRGMGLLGFRNILYFSRNFKAIARRNLSAANHPTKGYSFAIVAINITELFYNQMIQDVWKPLFCTPNRDSILPNKSTASMDNLHEIFCSIFNEFHEFWFLEDRNIMEFGKYREQFKSILESKYRSDPFSLQLLSSHDD